MCQVTRQPLVGRVSVRMLYHSIQFGFQPPGGRPQAMLGEFALLVTISQLEPALEQALHSNGKATAGAEAIRAISRQRRSRWLKQL